MKKLIFWVVCLVLMISMVSVALGEPWFKADNALWYNRQEEQQTASPMIWYAWDVPEWSYMPFYRYMEDWFKPVKLPIYELEFELGEPVYL